LKQVIQNYKTGELKVEQVSYPLLSDSSCTIKTKYSLISAGTERSKIETAQMNLVEKAISRLDLVKTVFNNIKQEGVIFTLKKAFNKLNTPISLGYSCSGEIVELSEDLKEEYSVGDRVACIGEGYATHAEYNNTFCDWFVKIPETISDEEAAFTGLGAIALNAAELSQVTNKEKVVVIGLGLLGQILVQILKARGAKVLGIDLDDSKLQLAKKLGLDYGVNILTDDAIAAVNSFTKNIGADAILITAASSNNLPIAMAGQISRNKGRVILVGSMPIEIPRDEYYRKELIFIISRGFGADIYFEEDPDREYPYNYDSKSMKQNMIDFLDLMLQKKLHVLDLISHRFSLDQAKDAYFLINSKEPYLGILFEYEGNLDVSRTIVHTSNKIINKEKVNIGFIGAGSFAQGYILPILQKRKDVNLVGVATARGITASSAAQKFGFAYSTTDYDKILDDELIDTIFIMTRHNLHAKFVLEALKRKKRVFVEKPLCLNSEELEQIKKLYNEDSVLMVGFNRRFSPFIKKAKKMLASRVGPVMLTYRVNAGFLPSDHWLHAKEGGGRILGEGCHFIDLVNFLVGSDIKNIEVLGSTIDGIISDENFNVTISYADGSIANIQYSSIGDISYSRERLEIFGDNSSIVVDNYKTGHYSRSGTLKKIISLQRDMGYINEVNGFINMLKKENKSIIPFEDIVFATETTFKINSIMKS